MSWRCMKVKVTARMLLGPKLSEPATFFMRQCNVNLQQCQFMIIHLIISNHFILGTVLIKFYAATFIQTTIGRENTTLACIIIYYMI